MQSVNTNTGPYAPAHSAAQERPSVHEPDVPARSTHPSSDPRRHITRARHTCVSLLHRFHKVHPVLWRQKHNFVPDGVAPRRRELREYHVEIHDVHVGRLECFLIHRALLAQLLHVRVQLLVVEKQREDARTVPLERQTLKVEERHRVLAKCLSLACHLLGELQLTCLGLELKHILTRFICARWSRRELERVVERNGQHASVGFSLRLNVAHLRLGLTRVQVE
ncbi:hypothetical protein FVE85_0053 [Porphyridium purpureum]|uniref:Uncharacterized protein n=1 Tax=Porphyridium purpureum TaxID=35688 RepID=A0A5J4Z022_PORPP|nr:hypothetical protein FVE85_0053 [Porphyridium purpureum]|eukprot:POR3153..scf208_2